MYLVRELTFYLWPNHKITSLTCTIGINSNISTCLYFLLQLQRYTFH